MIDPLEDAREALARAVGYAGNLRASVAFLIQHGEETDRKITALEERVARLEEPDRPPSGLMMGGDG